MSMQVKLRFKYLMGNNISLKKFQHLATHSKCTFQLHGHHERSLFNARYFSQDQVGALWKRLTVLSAWQLAVDISHFHPQASSGSGVNFPGTLRAMSRWDDVVQQAASIHISTPTGHKVVSSECKLMVRPLKYSPQCVCNPLQMNILRNVTWMMTHKKIHLLWNQMRSIHTVTSSTLLFLSH